MIEDIENEYMRNRDNNSNVGMYPRTVSEAYDYLTNFHKDPRNITRILGQGTIDATSGVAFVQAKTASNEENNNAVLFAKGKNKKCAIDVG
mmetsp:Transcript_6154/g.8903  ORF Transcript_6154/g.8903 Transcript_6154/m.8903 type:complete len:91 (-) Transcript_6154:684-956(-)